MYRAVRRAFFLIPAERIHTWVFTALRTGTSPTPARRAMAKRLAPRDPVQSSRTLTVGFFARA